MKKVLLIGLVFLVVSITSVNSSHAVVIDFNDLESPGTGATFMSSYSNSGFTLTTDPYGNGLASLHHDNGWYFGSANLLNNTANGWAILTSSSGLFTINSMDLHGLQGTSTIDFYVNDIDKLSYALPDATAWHTVNFGPEFENISSLKWQQVVAYHSFDNIVLNQTVVPEPAAMFLFGIGGAAMAFIRKKKQAA